MAAYAMIYWLAGTPASVDETFHRYSTNAIWDWITLYQDNLGPL